VKKYTCFVEPLFLNTGGRKLREDENKNIWKKYLSCG
jgi:hypothetical protein